MFLKILKCKIMLSGHVFSPICSDLANADGKAGCRAGPASVKSLQKPQAACQIPK